MSEETKKCKHCQTDIPKKAKVCPNCRKKQGGKLKWILISLFIIGLIGSLLEDDNKEVSTSSKIETVVVEDKTETVTESKETEQIEEAVVQEEQKEIIPEISEEEFKSLCAEYKYKDVLRNPENYIGEKVKIRVKISSVHEAGMLNPDKYYLSYSQSEYGWYGDYYGIIDKRVDNSLKLLSDDVIEVYGEIADPEYTKSLILSSEEIFIINMKYCELISE